LPITRFRTSAAIRDADITGNAALFSKSKVHRFIPNCRWCTGRATHAPNPFEILRRVGWPRLPDKIEGNGLDNEVVKRRRKLAGTSSKKRNLG